MNGFIQGGRGERLTYLHEFHSFVQQLIVVPCAQLQWNDKLVAGTVLVGISRKGNLLGQKLLDTTWPVKNHHTSTSSYTVAPVRKDVFSFWKAVQ